MTNKNDKKDTMNNFGAFFKKSWNKWSVAIKIMPLIILMAIFKFYSHEHGFEGMELTGLFTSLVGGTIFLIGFLISGVFSDYKESEKIPSELSASLRTLLDDSYTVLRSKNSEAALGFMEFQKTFVKFLIDWFYKKETTSSMLDKISEMNEHFINLDIEEVHGGIINKMKNEQGNLRKMILRIDTIRETDFIGSAYAIVEVMAIFIGIGLLLLKIEPFYASLFLTLIITFLISYMLFLIKDIDNPFDYSIKGESGTEISLKPIHDLEKMYNKSEKFSIKVLD